MTQQKNTLSFILALFFSFPLFAQIELTPDEAKDYFGIECIVKGKAMEVVELDGIKFINLDKKYPNNPFNIVIFERDFQEFESIDLQDLIGKEISVLGTIKIYNDKPQIILYEKEQLNILD